MTERTNFTLREHLRMLRPILLGQKRRLGLIVAASVLSAITAAFLPWPLKFLIDVALAHSPGPAWLPAPEGSALPPGLLVAASALALFLLTALSVVLASALQWLWEVAGQTMVFELAGEVLARLQRKSLPYFSSQHTGELLNRIAVDCWAVYQLAAQLLVSPLRQTLTILVIGVMAFILSPNLALVLFITTPFLGASVWFLSRRLKESQKSRRQAEARVSAFTQQVITNIPVVQVYGLEPFNRLRFSKLAREVVARVRTAVLRTETFAFVNATALAAGVSLVLIFGSREVLAGNLSVGSMLVFVAYVNKLKQAFTSLLSNFAQVRGIEAQLDRVMEVLSDSREVPELPNAKDLVLASARSGPEIRFENISFRYEKERAALQDVSFVLNPGETLALVGETGSGKSTIAALIPRFFDPTKGRILIDGNDIRDVSLRRLRSQISLVLQEPLLLPISIRENIAFGVPDADMEQIRKAAELANADDFISALTDGYDTVIGELGATLSGGQKQRIAIARALIKNSPILIMDEPTSALDPATEAKVVSAVERLAKDRTTVIIAHRLTTVKKADRVAVVADGRIAEIGTPDELLRQKGIFWRYSQLAKATERQAAS